MSAMSCSVRYKNETKCPLEFGGLRRRRRLWNEACHSGELLPELSVSRLTVATPHNSPEPLPILIPTSPGSKNIRILSENHQ